LFALITPKAYATAAACGADQCSHISIPAIFHKISRLLTKYNNKTIHIPARKNIHMIRSVKNKLRLNVLSIYLKVYIGQIGRTIGTRCKEHMRDIHLGQPEKSAVVEHSIEMGHRTDFNSICILGKATGYIDCLMKEATEIRLHPNIFNGATFHLQSGMIFCDKHA
jgi:hypothetical protein